MQQHAKTKRMVVHPEKKAPVSRPTRVVRITEQLCNLARLIWSFCAFFVRAGQRQMTASRRRAERGRGINPDDEQAVQARAFGALQRRRRFSAG